MNVYRYRYWTCLVGARDDLHWFLDHGRKIRGAAELHAGRDGRVRFEHSREAVAHAVGALHEKSTAARKMIWTHGDMRNASEWTERALSGNTLRSRVCESPNPNAGMRPSSSNSSSVSPRYEITCWYGFGPTPLSRLCRLCPPNDALPYQCTRILIISIQFSTDYCEHKFQQQTWKLLDEV